MLCIKEKNDFQLLGHRKDIVLLLSDVEAGEVIKAIHKFVCDQEDFTFSSVATLIVYKVLRKDIIDYWSKFNDRNTAIYKKWKKIVLKRDNHQCQNCDAIERLEVHHIKSYAEYPMLRVDPNNGITLCYTCHKEVHKNGNI